MLSAYVCLFMCQPVNSQHNSILFLFLLVPFHFSSFIMCIISFDIITKPSLCVCPTPPNPNPQKSSLWLFSLNEKERKIDVLKQKAFLFLSSYKLFIFFFSANMCLCNVVKRFVLLFSFFFFFLLS